MPRKPTSAQAAVPSVDRVLRAPAVVALAAVHGRVSTRDAVRETLAELRAEIARDGASADAGAAIETVSDRTASRLAAAAQSTLRPVFNLTGTVLHTNLGRAIIPEAAIEAMVRAARAPVSLEYDVRRGRRGDRDSHLDALLCRLCGAEAATVVNNNAAAVMLILNTLALRRDVPVSRGELIEIGGAFRMPDIMARAGARLIEVGTTNRTHLEDYAAALGPRTALIMKVHTSNYVIEGFTACVPEKALGALAHDHGLPFAVDLGSGSLVDLRRFGLAHEPTAAEVLDAGADLVCFSADKLLGGPQAGVIAGRRALIARIKRNPMRRAMRLDKIAIAGLEATLRLYLDPERLVRALPTLRHMARPPEEIAALAGRLALRIAAALGQSVQVDCAPAESQVGSGALPSSRLPSTAVVIRARVRRRGAGAALARIESAFRALPVPVIGRVHDAALWLDARCLDDEDAFAAQLDQLSAG
ncbi:MAG TPA: L-seryl-tRNA(Sec) selenium transferase [Rhodospirillales bacterium]|jgi:L-seryl-tRNA(Ser) seleniumtransferase|nr:L-seryl-tRNA(Sec) selenium transferase [Rhodospirillales bacterium]HJO69645.1 L-seryl-tRNA(Sec) selenium transferase [Rhodospirillales bacterium]